VIGIDRAHVLEESQRKEAALATKNRELQRATLLKDQFLANMSHELRTPLNAIIGFSEILLNESPAALSAEERQEFQEHILASGRHLLGLINDILDLSKVEAGRMELELARFDLVLAAADVPAQTPTVVKLGTLAPNGSAWHEILKDIGHRWSEASSGAVTLRIYAGGVQGGEGDMIRKLRIGQLQAAALSNVGLHDVTPEPKGLSLPLLFADEAEAECVFDAVRPDLDAALSWAARCPGAAHGSVEVRPVWAM